jgi:hypothetical protein
MPSRKKAYVLLRGVLRGQLIVGSRVWYEREQVAKTRRWKLVAQHNDQVVLLKMAELSNPQPEPLFNDNIDKWFER